MKWSVKDYFLKAGICHLASQVPLSPQPLLPPPLPSPPLSPFLLPPHPPPKPPPDPPPKKQDIVATQRALATYTDLDPTFPSTRESQLLRDLTEAVEKGEQEMFADRLFQYDQLSKLDKWKTTILLRVKEGIEAQGEDFA